MIYVPAPGAGEVITGTQGHAPDSQAPPIVWAGLGVAVLSGTSAALICWCFLLTGHGHSAQAALEGWLSPLTLGSRELSVCKWEKKRLLSSCVAALQGAEAV